MLSELLSSSTVDRSIYCPKVLYQISRPEDMNLIKIRLSPWERRKMSQIIVSSKIQIFLLSKFQTLEYPKPTKNSKKYPMMSKRDSATSLVWTFLTRKLSFATHGALSCSQDSSSPFTLIQSWSTNGKFKANEKVSDFLFRIYENIYGNCVKKDLNFQKVVEQVFGHTKLSSLI